VIFRLLEVAHDSQTAAAHRARLVETVGRIPEHAEILPNADTYIVNALLDGFRVSSPEMHEKATEAVCLWPANIVNQLILWACCNLKKPDYAVRLLKAAEQTGHRPSLDRLSELL